ncbi:MAG TPA: hypothetical protein DHV60_08945 [Verrucomicrobiales bacterium]|nr:hypothetical protein [Verrucomicrobiales bacterium]
MTKNTTMIVALTLCVGALAQADDTAAQRANSLYKQGVIAMNEGKYDIARTTFREVLRINPKHLPARKKFLFISSNRRSLAIRDRKNALCKVLIPKVHLDKAPVRESLDMLAVQVERESQQKTTPNFIIQDPTGAFKNSRVNLRLERIPAETLLRYIVDQAGGYIRYDNHAIIVSPRVSASSKMKK